MSKIMDFRVRINSDTQPELFNGVDYFPSQSRAELARKAIAEYLRLHFHMDIPVNSLDGKTPIKTVANNRVNENKALSKDTALSMIE